MYKILSGQKQCCGTARQTVLLYFCRATVDCRSCMMRAFFLGVPPDAASAKVCQLTHAADAGAADRSPKSENPKSEVRRSEVRTFTRFFDDIIAILCFMKLFTPVTVSLHHAHAACIVSRTSYLGSSYRPAYGDATTVVRPTSATGCPLLCP